MQYEQLVITALFGFLAFIGFIWALVKCHKKRLNFELSPRLFVIYGAFVWADLVVFGAFWTVVALLCLILQDWILFLLSISIFWLIRSIGETIYWFLQQFTPRRGNEPQKFLLYKLFRDDSVWFVLQIFWQCITVVTIISSLYLGKIWLQSL